MPDVEHKPTLTQIGGVWHTKTANRLIPHANWDEAALTAKLEAAKPLIEIISAASPDPLTIALDAAAEEYFHLTAYVDHETAVDVLSSKHDLDAEQIEEVVAQDIETLGLRK